MKKSIKQKDAINLSILILGIISFIYIVLYRLVLVNLREIFANASSYGQLLNDISLAIFTGIFIWFLTIFLPALNKNKKVRDRIHNHTKSIVNMAYTALMPILNKRINKDFANRDLESLQEFTQLLEANKKDISENEMKLVLFAIELYKKQMERELFQLSHLLEADDPLYEAISLLHNTNLFINFNEGDIANKHYSFNINKVFLDLFVYMIIIQKIESLIETQLTSQNNPE